MYKEVYHFEIILISFGRYLDTPVPKSASMVYFNFKIESKSIILQL
jgi:hypothetical protein